MATYYPVFVTIALFIAIVLDDLALHSPEKIMKHSLEGLVCTVLMLILSHNDMEIVSWMLLIFPLITLIIAYRYASLKGPTIIPATEALVARDAVPPPMMSVPIDASSTPSMISVPASPTMSATVAAQPPPTFTPITGCGT
jgi:hypothetical protein